LRSVPSPRTNNMPKVTVVTPNFNYARFLPQRLESILAQTYHDFELIIIDNASTDNSREVIESYAKEPRVSAFFNAQNNGSTFKQWHLGLSRAKGEYIWFAESDDYADHSLLETLVDRLDRNPNVGLAYCQSWAVDEQSAILCNMIDKLERLPFGTSRWRSDFLNSGRDECGNYLYWTNTIPNASAVLLRRNILERAGGPPLDMLLAGDWVTYINMLAISDVAFVSTPLNYFRHHECTVRNRLSNDPEVAVSEMIRLHRALTSACGLPKHLRDNKEALINQVGYWIDLARRPPHNKVPARVSLTMLRSLARLHPTAFKEGLRLLTRDQLAELARRAGLLNTARKLLRLKVTEGSR
jgi:glycosyltransferase involved in cell wall biosynthesis